ncbi:MAG: hypothetical protein ACRDZR_13605, partial [Acidimicrobiales bacterium]
MRTRHAVGWKPLRVRVGRWSRLTRAGLGVLLLAGAFVLGLAGPAPAAEPSLTWSAPVALGPTAFSLSCGTPSFCMVTTLSTGSQVFVFDGTTWTSATAPEAMNHVACAPGTRFCVGVGAAPHGSKTTPTVHVYTYTGGTWSAATSLAGSSLSTVSCASPAFCLLANNNKSWTFDGTGWSSTPTPIDPAHSPVATVVTCTTATSCTALASSSRTGPLEAVTFDGTWGTPVTLGTVLRARSLSCAPGSGGACAAVLSTGETVHKTATSTWSAPVPLPTGTADGVSCPVVGDCFFTSADGHVLQYVGGWTTPPATVATTAITTLSQISCPTTGFCAVIGTAGTVVTGQYVPGPHPLSSVTWSVSSNEAGAGGATYSWALTTASTATLSSLTLSVAPGTTSAGLTVDAAYGLDATGVTATLTGTTVTLRVTSQRVARDATLSIVVSGFTNPAGATTASSEVITRTTAGTPVDEGTSNPVTFTAGTTQVTVTVPESLQFTNSAPSVFIEG